ncbi:phosphoenolpyruvate--protein phosphotransferase [Klebsiella quasipneumoniae]|nr:phosphoenolpyruvate--protein phosphotransferase [Klebsiella quasipneumoniae]
MKKTRFLVSGQCVLIRNIATFSTQLKAILSASASGKAKIMLPMISRVEELIWCREVLESVKQEMRHEGLAFDEQTALGIMLEVPSVLFSMAEMAEHADFFSVGSNDLTQYFFAADRGNAQVKTLYDSYTPPFLRALQFAVKEAHRAGKPVGLCGELTADETILPLLIGIGFDELSMNCTAIPGIKHALGQLSAGDCRSLAQNLCKITTHNSSKPHYITRALVRRKSRCYRRRWFYGELTPLIKTRLSK